MSYNLSFVSDSMCERTQKACSEDYLLRKKLLVREYPNAIILPIKEGYDDDGRLAGGLVSEDGTFVENSAFAERKGYTYEYDQIEAEEEAVIYIGLLLNIFGHTFSDNLKKLWYLSTQEGNESVARGAKVCYVTTGNKPLAPYAIKFLKLAGFDPSSWVHITQVTRCQRCIVPDDSFGCEDIFKGGYYTKEFIETIDRIKQNVLHDSEKNYPEKLYFTRSRIPNNSWREMGEECIEKVFIKNGFKIISPEKLSIEVQLNYLIHCKEFATTEGSVSHSAVFCNPGTKVYIVRKVDQVNHYQLVLNQVANLDVTYIDAHISVQATPERPNWGPFYMCVTSELEKFAGHKIWHLPLWLRPSWWWYNNRNRRIVKQLYRNER